MIWLDLFLIAAGCAGISYLSYRMGYQKGLRAPVFRQVRPTLPVGRVQMHDVEFRRIDPIEVGRRTGRGSRRDNLA